MLAWLSKRSLNGAPHYSFVALLLPCLVCVALLRQSASVNSAPARSPEACFRAHSSSPIPIQIQKRSDEPYRLVGPLSPGIPPRAPGQPRESSTLTPLAGHTYTSKGTTSTHSRQQSL